MDRIETDVLVVGAGPAGLTAACLLAREGIDALTLTKYGTADAPRAHITNQRAVEIFRDLGIEEQVQARALPNHLMGKQVFATSFAGRELSRLMTWGTGDDRIGEYRAASPSAMCNAPQHILEPILLDARAGTRRRRPPAPRGRLGGAGRRTASRRAFARATAAPSSRSSLAMPSAAMARAPSSAATARSSSRAKSGLGDAITVWIEADLALHRAPLGRALLHDHAGQPRHAQHLDLRRAVERVEHHLPAPDLSPNELDESAVVESVRAAIGDDDVPFRDQEDQRLAVQPHRGLALPARAPLHRGRRRAPPPAGERARQQHLDPGRVQPRLEARAGSFGGRPATRCSTATTTERQPVGRPDRRSREPERARDAGLARRARPRARHDATEQVEARLDALFGPDGGEDSGPALLAGLELMNGQFNAHGVELGQRYRSRAVAAEDAPPPEPARDTELHFEPSTYPGSPIPHAWLDVGGPRSVDPRRLSRTTASRS